jgi:protein phosphatase
MLQFRAAIRASQGARSYQEDAASVWPGDDALSPPGAPADGTGLVAVLADGMGGHAAGDVASRTICGVFLQSIAASRGRTADRLMTGLSAANDAIRRHVTDNPGLEGMGATLVAAHFGTAGCEWVSVGDSPIWLFRAGELVRLNEDHSLAPVLDKMVAEGRMDAEDARHDPRRHYLRSAVTGEDIELIDASEHPLRLVAGDIVLVASDGVLTLEDEEIRRLMQAYARDGIERIADALVRAVDNAGVPHQDNTTLVLIETAATT